MTKYIRTHNAPLSGGYVNGSSSNVSIGVQSSNDRQKLVSDDNELIGSAATTHGHTALAATNQETSATWVRRNAKLIRKYTKHEKVINAQTGPVFLAHPVHWLFTVSGGKSPQISKTAQKNVRPVTHATLEGLKFEFQIWKCHA